MRMIILLVVLLLIGLLIQRQLSHNASTETGKAKQEAGVAVPDTPQGPEDVKAFGEQLESFVEDAKSERDKRIEQESR